jgi:uncharacterized damage-inducible protein DinB
MNSRATFLEDNARLLGRLARLLDELAVADYACSVEALGGASIGGHVRHCIDFVESLLGRAGDGRLDYDCRPREERLETDPRHARERLDALAEALRRDRAPAGALAVKQDGGPSGPWADSSAERELLALASHTLHHMALIAVALRLGGRPVPADFGVAPSTQRHRAAHSGSLCGPPCAP